MQPRNDDPTAWKVRENSEFGADPHQTVVVASRKAIAYTPSINEFTLATEARPGE